MHSVMQTVQAAYISISKDVKRFSECTDSSDFTDKIKI